MQQRRKAEFASRALDAFALDANYPGVPHRPTFIREWRKRRHLTVEQLAGRIEMSTSNTSRLERGLIPYNQQTLEAVASALNVEPAALLQPPPNEEQEEWRRLLAQLEPSAAARALRVVRAMISGEKDEKVA